MMKKICLMLLVFIVLSISLVGCDNKSDSLSLPKDNEKTEEEKKDTRVDIDILKIGKADCIVINTGEKIVMIDTGEEENLSQIRSFMQKKGYTSIDTLILSHYDKDHIGGACEIISEYKVKNVIESNFSHDSELYFAYHEKMRELSITPTRLKDDTVYTYGDCVISINAPKKKKYASKEDNNSSLVVSMRVGEKSFLFCGDAMEIRLEELIYQKIGHHDFVKLPYHGVYIENYKDFFDEITPSYGAITCSGKNPADDQTLNLLLEYGVEYYQTRNGEIHVFTDGKTIKIEQ